MRPFAFALLSLAFGATAFAADAPVARSAAPETFLSPLTQFYVRWDGTATHKTAYEKSIWGPIMAGPSGDGIRTLLARGPKLLGDARRAGLALDGKSLAELKADLADVKATEKVIELVADKGVILAVEVREPALTFKNLGQAFGGLVVGQRPALGTLSPDVQVILIVPDAGDKAEVLFGTLRVALAHSAAFSSLFGSNAVEPFETKGRKGFRLGQEGPEPEPVQAAWWAEGKHFVFYAGTRKPEDIVTEMIASAANGGLTNHPLFQRCRKAGSFESVARGFVDTKRAIGLVNTLAGPLVPGLKEHLNEIGVSDLQAVVFSSGFDGKESRASYEFDVPGERKGVLKALKGGAPLGLYDLPPMPPDVSRFSALRLDPAATYDAGLGLIDFLVNSGGPDAEADADKGDHATRIKARKERMARAVDKALGISVADDLLPHLGDKWVTFQSPTEGFQLIGTVLCISVRDAEKVKTALGQVPSGIEAVARTPVKVRERVLKGVAYREFYARGFGGVTPTYAVVDGWLVVALYPQAVQGVILRAKGHLEKWKPDAATANRLAKMPAGFGLQFCDPRPTVSNLCVLGAPFLSGLNLLGDNEAEDDFDPIETSILPNAHELNRPLFPNLTVARDDGKTIRVEVNESFSVPFEMIGVESLSVLAAFGLTR